MESTRRVTMVELETRECWRLLAQAPVGRVAVAVDDGPDIFPVNHVVDDGRILFRTSAGTKLFAADGRDVAFEVDGIDSVDGEEHAWSVVARGVATALRGAAELARVDDLPLTPWWDSEKAHVLAIDAPTLTGRRFPVNRSAATA